MAAGHLGAVAVIAQGAANALDLVGRHGHANAGGADDDTLFALAAGYRTGHFFRVNGIVHALGVVAAEVLKLVVVLLQPDQNILLQQVAAVVAADGNFHVMFLLVLFVSVKVPENQASCGQTW